jgi:group I intron endonuclease
MIQIPFSFEKGFIYKITNPKGCVYIGKTKNVNERFKFYRLLHCKKQVKIYRSILKYGWESHKAEIIHTIPYDENELNKLEVEYIKLFDSFNSSTGLNLTPGGKSGFVSEENRRLLSQHRTGKKLSEATKQKLREINLGKKQSAETIAKRVLVIKGMKRSEQSRKNISMARTGIVFSESHKEAMRNAKRPPITEESKKKRSDSMKLSPASFGRPENRTYKGKKVINVLDNKEFQSLKAACHYYGLVYDTIKAQINGYNKNTSFLKRA